MYYKFIKEIEQLLMRSARTPGHWCSAGKGRSQPLANQGAGRAKKEEPGDTTSAPGCHGLPTTPLWERFTSLCFSFCSFPRGTVIFLCLGSTGDMISVHFLLVAVVGDDCMGSPSEEGCGSAPEVLLGINRFQLCRFPPVLFHCY